MRTTRDSNSRPAKAAALESKSPAAAALDQPLRALLADVFTLYLKTRNFHWHVHVPHFRDYHLMFDEQADQIYAMTDEIAERARKLGCTTLRSIGDVAKHRRLKDNDAADVAPSDMLSELRDDNQALASSLLATHDLCDEHGDVATASLIENWIDEAEKRAWYLGATLASDR